MMLKYVLVLFVEQMGKKTNIYIKILYERYNQTSENGALAKIR